VYFEGTVDGQHQNSSKESKFVFFLR